jgi:hypothetical protein
MHLTLRGIAYEGVEIERYILLRKLEWEAFPVYATRAIAPVALFWIPWWQLILILVLASIIWCPIRNHVANPELSDVASSLNNIYVSLPANIVLAGIFFWQGRIPDSFVTLFWNLISTVIGFAYPRSRESALEDKLWSRVQSEPNSSDVASDFAISRRRASMKLKELVTAGLRTVAAAARYSPAWKCALAMMEFSECDLSRAQRLG